MATARVLVADGEGKHYMDEAIRRILDEMDRDEQTLLVTRSARRRSRQRRDGADGDPVGQRDRHVVRRALVGLFIARSLTRQIGSTVRHIQSSSAELQAAANQQATGAKEQATAMNEITTTISELLATSKQIAESARRVSSIATDTVGSARSGRSDGPAHRANPSPRFSGRSTSSSRTCWISAANLSRSAASSS